MIPPSRHPLPSSLPLPPPLLLGAALLYWGAVTNTLPWAIPLALLLEIRPLIPWRWQPELKDFQRVADLGTLLLLGIMTSVFMGDQRPMVLAILRNLPLAVYPLLLGVTYSDRQGIPAAALFFSLRRKQVSTTRKETPLPIHYPFLGLCLLAAGASTNRPAHYFLTLLLFLLPALWPMRRHQVNMIPWLAMIALAATMGIGVHTGLSSLQEKVGDWLADLWADVILGDPDPFHHQTALGRVGSLKGGHGILFQAREQGSGSAVLLLKEAGYNLYVGPSWHTAEAPLENREPVPGEPVWVLGEKPLTKPQTVEVHRSFHREKGLLFLPPGTARVERLPAAEFSHNRLGAHQVQGAAETVVYRALFDPTMPLEGPPDRVDLQIPERERPALEKAWRKMGGNTGLDGNRIVAQVREFLGTGFSYTLRLPGEPPAGSTALAEFLLNQRSGHCEYFATATVMLLRQAGVAARYAVGYSVQEPPDDNGWRPVRQRHAHAWAQAWLDGRWRDVDTTPMGWPELEAGGEPVWQPVLDWWAGVRFRLVRWRLLDEGEDGVPVWMYGVLAILVGVLGWRLGRQGERITHAAPGSAPPAPGQDSPFRAVEAHLARQGRQRPAGATSLEWVRKLGDADLLPLVAWHYRLRFDPQGLDNGEMAAFRRQVEAWLVKTPPTTDGCPPRSPEKAAPDNAWSR